MVRTYSIKKNDGFPEKLLKVVEPRLYCGTIEKLKIYMQSFVSDYYRLNLPPKGHRLAVTSACRHRGGLLSPIRYLMFQIDNVNESKEFLPRIPPLSQSTKIKHTMRPAIVTISLKATMKKLMETQTDVVILFNGAKSEEAVPGALIAQCIRTRCHLNFGAD